MASLGIICSLRNFTETTSHLFPNPVDRAAKVSYSRKQLTNVPDYVIDELRRNNKVTHLTLHHNLIVEIPLSFFDPTQQVLNFLFNRLISAISSFY